MSEQVCPIGGCVARIPVDKLMCRSHWYMVPADLRPEVYRTWRRRQQARGTDEWGAAVQVHRAVKEQAIAAVEGRLAARASG